MLAYPRHGRVTYKRLRLLRSFWGIIFASTQAEVQDNMQGDIALARATNFCPERKKVIIQELRPAHSILLEGFDADLAQLRYTFRQGEDDARRFLDVHQGW